MALSFLYLAFVRILQLLRLIRRDTEELAIEVVVLRHEVAVLRRQVARPALRPSDRALLAGLNRLLGRQRLNRFFIQPETLLRWHRDLVRRRWNYPTAQGDGIRDKAAEMPTTEGMNLCVKRIKRRKMMRTRSRYGSRAAQQADHEHARCGPRPTSHGALVSTTR
jgi:hypothetical protein